METQKVETSYVYCVMYAEPFSLDVADVVVPHTLEAAPESGACAPGLVRVNGAGCLPDGLLQVRNADMSGRVGLLFNHAPHPEVAWIQVG